MNIRGVKISIITAVYNRKETIEDCINSFSQQTYKNREQIIIDGESFDGTIDILNLNKDKFSILLSEKDNGIYEALNKGIHLSTGDVIGFLHADDIFYDSGVLAKIAKAFEDPNVGAVYGDLQYVKYDNLNKIVRTWVSSPFKIGKLRFGWMPPHPTLYVRREWYRKISNFDTSFKIASDYHSILKLFSELNLNPKYLPSTFIKMRTGGISNGTFRGILLKSSEDMRALNMVNIGGFLTLIIKNIRKINQFL